MSIEHQTSSSSSQSALPKIPITYFAVMFTPLFRWSRIFSGKILRTTSTTSDPKKTMSVEELRNILQNLKTSQNKGIKERLLDRKKMFMNLGLTVVLISVSWTGRAGRARHEEEKNH